MEQVGQASGGHPNLNLTPEEKRVYAQLLKEADPDGFGAVSGDVAVKFFERTRLPPDILGQIWQIADTENRGFLTPAGFGVVLRLIGHAQAGRAPSIATAPSPAPLPKFDGVSAGVQQHQQQTAPQAPQPPQPPQPPAQTVPPPAQPIVQPNIGIPASPSSGPPGVRVPALGPDKVNEYSALFEKSGAENGQLSGFVAKQIFERARLPNEALGRIWNLADTQGRGSLDVTEFVIAMHLLASYKSGAMRGVPNTLPPGLLDAAARRTPARLSGGMSQPGRPTSGAGPPSIMQPQFTGMNVRPQSPIVRQQTGAGTPLSVQSTGEPWLISMPDKQKFDSIFATIDTAGQGFITGEQAVQFFGNARLPEEVLAQIWDLADINSDGILNRDEFAVAMYLIRQQRGSRDGRVPQRLPLGLVPPSMRKQQMPSQPQNVPAFDEAPVTKPKSAADDLFGVEFSDPAPAPVQAQQQPPAPQQAAQSTGGMDPFSNPRSTASPPPSTIFKPFVPSSNFGQGLMPQATDLSKQGQANEASLMDDAEDEAPAKINNDAVELGNLSNQVGNLSKQMTDLQGQRGQAEAELSQTAQQKQMFQQRLTQLRVAYDQEVQQVKSLKEQLAQSQAEMKRLQQDMAMIEGSYADLSTQRQQLASALAADQQENASLKEKMRQTNAETEQLKPQLERLKSDARQQKGLVAINKKQLATNQAEYDRIKAEMAAAQRELENAKRETEESARQAEASQRDLEQAKEAPLPAPIPRELSPPPQSQVASPTPSISSNPFFRRQDSGGAVFSPPIGSAITSPAPDHERNAAFDSIFGPSFGNTLAEPATSFGGDTPEFRKPVRSETPKVVEPPAPPQETQIESSALPIRNAKQQADSTTSSVQVAAPDSRLSPAHTPRGLTPDTSTASPSSHRADDPFISSAVDEEQESVRRTLPRGETSRMLETLPGAFPDSRLETPAQASSRSESPAQLNPTAVAIGAGAATLAAGAGIAAAVNEQEEKKTTPLAADKNDNFDDFFGGPSHKKTLSQQHADSDAAFASIDSGTAKQPINGQFQAFNQEFPDIHELNDDDSSSDSDDEPRGFDDHFAPTQSSTAAGKQPEMAPAVGSMQPPPLETHASSQSLPGFDQVDQQMSPPSYKEVIPNDNPNHFPMEYKNLLPEREDPTSPPLPTAGGSAHPGPNPAGMPPAYGPESVSRSASQSEPTTQAPPTKAAPFDFDLAFANMGQAPVAVDESESDSDYDDRTPSGVPKAQPAEFDPSFDSPAASTRTTNTTQQSQPTFSVHDAVTGPSTNGTMDTATTQPTRNTFNDFHEFNSNPFPPSRTGTSTVGSSTTSPIAATSSNHDWDALFAPLGAQSQSQPQPGESTASPTAAQGSIETFGSPRNQTTNAQQQATETGPGLKATTTLEAVPNTGTLPQQSISNIPQTNVTASSPTASNFPSTSPTATEPGPAPTTTETGSNLRKSDRPQPGRALSAGTEHDDPILKRLTAMGWSRSESLDALERFDYNIDKAADYLTFRS